MKKVAAILVSFLIPSTLVSVKGEDLLDMDLDGLLNLNVVTATKTSSKIDDVPAIIEVITDAQIKQRGYRHLADVLSDLNNNHEDRSNWGIGEPTNQNVSFGFRFDTGQNMLLLFNGQRINAFLPGNRFGGEEYLLDNIDKIEIIRGPGSALYGANAFTAVVNIISKSRLKEDEAPYFKIGAAGNATSNGKEGRGSWGRNVGSNGFLGGAFRIASENGEDIFVQNDLFGDSKIKDGISHAADAEVFYSHKDFRTYLKATNQKRNTFTGFNGISPDSNDDLTLSMYAYSLGADYTHDVSKSFELKFSGGAHWDNWTEVALIPIFQLNAAGDGLLLDGSGNPILDTITIERDGQSKSTSFLIDGQGADTRTLDSEIQATWNYREKNNIVFGANYSHDKVLAAVRPTEIQIVPSAFVPFRDFKDDANNWLFDTNTSRTTLGFYGQLDYSPIEWLTLSGGGRHDLYSGTGSLNQNFQEFNPRAGIVYKNTTTGNVKLLYGRATRIPNGFETLSSVAILGSPSNRPEKIETYQVQWLKNFKKRLRVEFGGFRSAISDHLVTDANITDLQKAQGFIGQFVNAKTGGKLKVLGLDGKVFLKIRDIDAFVNFTRHIDTDDGTGNEIAYITNTMINTNVNIPVSWLNINIGTNYRGEVTKPSNDPRPPVSKYWLYNLTLLTNLKSQPYEFRIGARNLFNTDIRYPSSSLDFPEHFPGRGREVWASASYTF